MPLLGSLAPNFSKLFTYINMMLILIYKNFVQQVALILNEIFDTIFVVMSGVQPRKGTQQEVVCRHQSLEFYI